MGDTGTPPAQHGNSFHAKPLKLSILMAAYNEESTITRAIDEVLKADCPCEIELIVIDDGSTDATPKLLSSVDDPRVTVHHHPANQGKGAALLAAASFATGTHILPFDADLEYAAEDISRVLEPILKGRCEVVYGVRLFGYNTVYQTYLYAAGNRLLTRMANILFNAHLTDLHTCLKLIPLVMLRSMDLREKGFGLDSEITARLLRRGIRPFEVPVTYYGRSHADGKKIMWRDAVASAWILLRVRLRFRSCQEPANDRREEGDRARVGNADPTSQLVGHVSASDGDGDEFIRAVTG
jgi:glycosyltransferase involved in cell wall biosynthesis